jgi:hypothetical protein
MHHFSSADWVDFAHGLVSADRKTAIEQHLERGCQDCSTSSSFWRNVVEIGRSEGRFEPPAEAVTRVTNAYRTEKPASRLLEWANLARLIFDSALHVSPVAVRAAVQTSRQLIHESGPFTIDLRLEPDLGRKCIYLTGQIMNTENAAERAEGIDIILLRNGEQITKTEVTPTGEFCLDYNPAEDLHLFFNIRGLKGIAIALPEMDS